MVKRLMFLAVLLAVVFPVCHVKASVIPDSILQIIEGRDIRPDSLSGIRGIFSFSKWIYVMNCDFPPYDTVGHFIQFEKTDADTLKYVRSVFGFKNPAAFFFQPFAIKPLENGNGIAYVRTAQNNGSGFLLRFTVDPDSGTWTFLDSTATYGLWEMFSPDNKFVYYPGTSDYPFFQGYAINQTSGALTPVPEVPVNPNPTLQNQGCISNDGRFLYLAGGVGSNPVTYYVSVHKRNLITGSLDTATQNIRVMASADWAGIQVHATPNDRQLIVSGAGWEFYNINPVDGSLSLDTFIVAPGNTSGGEDCRIYFPYKTRGYANGGHHHTSQVWAFTWDTLKGGKSLNTATSFTNIFTNPNHIPNVAFDTARQAMYFGGFWHVHPGILEVTDPTIPRADSEFNNNRVVTVRMKGAGIPGYATPVQQAGETEDAEETLRATPDPFNPSTTLSYSLKTAGKVTLNVYDVSGRHVVRLVSAEQKPGRHSATFNGQGMASGVYVCKLTVGNRAVTRRIALVK